MSRATSWLGSAWARSGLSAVISIFAVGMASASASMPAANWTMGGQNYSDTHYNAAETTISPSNVSTLATTDRCIGS